MSIVAGSMLRSVCISPDFEEIREQFSISQFFKQAGVCGLADHAAGHDRGNEVDEFRTDDGKIALNIGFIKTFVALVAVEDQFQEPAVRVAGVGCLRVKVDVRFEDDDAEAFSLFPKDFS